MQNLTPKQIAILTAMKKIGIPSGVQRIMTESKGMESKTQVKNILDELVELKAVIFQSNSQYRATPEALKSVTAAAVLAPAIAVKPEAYQQRIKNLQAEVDNLKASIAEASKRQARQDDFITNIREASGCSSKHGQLELIQHIKNLRDGLKSDSLINKNTTLTANLDNAAKYASEQASTVSTLKKQLADEQNNSMTWLKAIADIRAAAGDNGKLPLSEFIDYLGQMHHNIETTAYLKSEIDSICEQVGYHPLVNDSFSQAVAAALEKAAANTQAFSINKAIQDISDMIGTLYDDKTRVVIEAGQSAEIIVFGSRYEIPTGTDKETEQFIESLAWITGQYIENEAA